ncbi:MAG: hypothetical protein WC285_06150 [Candidatus Gracilibacteria bacterium]|jgi:hypothetical protein
MFAKRDEESNFVNSIDTIDKNTVRCVTDLEFKRDYTSAGFVHGSDCFLPISECADRLLKPGEQITKIDYLRFQEIIIRNLLIFVSTEALQKNPEKVDQKPAIQGVLETSDKRKLYITGYQQGEVISRVTRGQERRSYSRERTALTIQQEPVTGDLLYPYLYRPEVPIPQNFGRIAKRLLDIQGEVATAIFGRGFAAETSRQDILTAAKINAGIKLVMKKGPIDKVKFTRNGFVLLPLLSKYMEPSSDIIYSDALGRGEGMMAQEISGDMVEQYVRSMGVKEIEDY